MFSTNHSDGSGDEDELALRITLQRSRMDMYDSSGSAPLPVARRLNDDTGAGHFLPARSSTRAVGFAPLVRQPAPPLSAAPQGWRWVLADVHAQI